MPVDAQVPKDSPLMIAWEAYKAAPDYENTRKWALVKEHVDGSLWAAFMAGYEARRALNVEGEYGVGDCTCRIDGGEFIEVIKDAKCPVHSQPHPKAKPHEEVRHA